MKISVYYDNGMINMFDTQPYVAGEPFRGDGKNILSEFRLVLDEKSLENEGVVLEVCFYDAAPSTNEPTGDQQLYPASRRRGRSIRLVSKSELAHVVKISCDNELLMWRQGGELINGVKFSIAEVLYYSDAATSSINARALTLHDYLRKAHPELSDEQAAKMIGYTKASLDYISVEESANMNVADDMGAEQENYDEDNGENWDFG